MAGSTVSAEIDEVRAALLAQVIRRDYLEQMLQEPNYWNRLTGQITLATYHEHSKIWWV
jgi:hypothetical protein